MMLIYGVLAEQDSYQASLFDYFAEELEVGHYVHQVSQLANSVVAEGHVELA